VIFYPLDPDPWIRIFLQIRIQEAKILRIRILRTDVEISKCRYSNKCGECNRTTSQYFDTGKGHTFYENKGKFDINQSLTASFIRISFK